ncbi:DUF2986 domain-containing protein [Saccharobesus litoralis]|uniref:DUF2986 domain-containing protein n=1 Tax=Saccharobesus litoralis TaxID=2172099 RepID=A0A2S0VNZ0_9ALTE|nr:DUF2986 domain-containing protein [Saccharobesus litoralis]
MNRKKKIYTILKKKQKKANAKGNRNGKPVYISKAERAKMAEQEVAVEASVEGGVEESEEEGVEAGIKGSVEQPLDTDSKL